MKKIVYLPLDERPCNAHFAQMLFESQDMTIVTPPVLSQQKQPASWDGLERFLKDECRDADGLVVSLDMLLYGGLLPSRVHHLTEETVAARLETLRALRDTNPGLVIFAFQCIMRCPTYSSDIEEPTYYADYGSEIHRIGNLRHRCELGLCDRAELEALEAVVPAEHLDDYLSRRAFNLSFNCRTLDMLREGVIDFLIIPQDDAARYGFTAMDQHVVRSRISEMSLIDRVLIYPGADEVGMTLISRMALRFAGRYPAVYVKFAATTAPSIIPLYEDRPLGETIKYHLIAAGCHLATSVSEADFVMAVSAPGSSMQESEIQPVTELSYTVERTLAEFVLFIRDCLDQGRIVTVCDNAYANGADLELVSALENAGLLPRLQGFAGWNTSSNTMGTAIAMGVHAYLYGVTPRHRDFLALRYAEDAGYCSRVRKDLLVNELPKRGLDRFCPLEYRGEISQLALDMLRDFIRTSLPSIADEIVLEDAWLPWARIFEIGLTIRWDRA